MKRGFANLVSVFLVLFASVLNISPEKQAEIVQIAQQLEQPVQVAPINIKATVESGSDESFSRALDTIDLAINAGRPVTISLYWDFCSECDLLPEVHLPEEVKIYVDVEVSGTIDIDLETFTSPVQSDMDLAQEDICQSFWVSSPYEVAPGQIFSVTGAFNSDQYFISYLAYNVDDYGTPSTGMWSGEAEIGEPMYFKAQEASSSYWIIIEAQLMTENWEEICHQTLRIYDPPPCPDGACG